MHGSAPKYAGQNKANPTALILSAALMLRHLGETGAADAVESAVRAVIAEGRTVTYDLGGSAGTREFGEAVAERVARATPSYGGAASNPGAGRCRAVDSVGALHIGLRAAVERGDLTDVMPFGYRISWSQLA